MKMKHHIICLSMHVYGFPFNNSISHKLKKSNGFLDLLTTDNP